MEPGEAGVEDGDGSLDDGAVLKGFNVSGVKGVGEVADLRTGAVAGDALAIFGLKNNKFCFKFYFYSFFYYSLQIVWLHVGVFLFNLTENIE